MPLTNSQYNAIMREYEKKQAFDERDFIERRDLVYKKIPEIRALDHEVSRLGALYSEKFILGEKNAHEELLEKYKEIEEKKALLLNKYDLSENFLEKHYSCNDCKDTGFIDGRPCHCFIQAEIDLYFSQNRLSEWFSEHTFNSFSLEYYSKTPHEENAEISDYSLAKHALSKTMDFSKKIISGNGDNVNNIVIFGGTGTGKTFLTHCVAGELIRHGKSCIYLTSPQLFDIISSFSFEHEGKNDFNSLFTSDLLIIDDLGAENVNSFVISGLFRVLNERSLSKKPVLISTNLSIKELQSIYTERIFSRIVGSSDFLQLSANDIRLQKKFET